jgi:hypothetical protein
LNAGGTFGVPVRNEVTGLGCLRVTPTNARLEFNWATSGRLLEGIFYYQLVECGSNKVVGSKTLSYPEGTRKRVDQGDASFPVIKGHQYKMRIIGHGSYQRRPDMAGALGKFYGAKGGPKEVLNPKLWRAESSCVEAK